MPIQHLLIANRGEIAVRIAETAAELGVRTLAIYAEDDADSPHRQFCDDDAALSGSGPRAYLDGDKILAIARDWGCDAVHPGYGFLSESGDFARACRNAGIQFVGPDAESLDLFGDKIAARQMAVQAGVPVAPASECPADATALKTFLKGLGGGPMVIKAAGGGGGRGMRVVTEPDQVEAAFQRCQSEARQAFGRDTLYGEALVEGARHMEVQIAADRHGTVQHLWERDCSLQRHHQKLIELAPAPELSEPLRRALCDAALQLAGRTGYQNLGTFEFLVDPRAEQFYFLEANPRLQVEHTVTEAITGLDLVRLQLEIAAGSELSALGLSEPPRPRGRAAQLRINMEYLDTGGELRGSGGGTIERFEIPGGPGMRVDSFVQAGYHTSPSYDSLLAKLICHTGEDTLTALLDKCRRALDRLRIEGLPCNQPLLRAILALPELARWQVDTGLLDRHMKALADQVGQSDAPAEEGAVLPESQLPVQSPLRGLMVDILVEVGQAVHTGQDLAVVESMKMEHVVTAPSAGLVAAVFKENGDSVTESTTLLALAPGEVNGPSAAETAQEDPTRIRPALAEALEYHRYGLDEHRPEAVAKRRKTGQRTARENIADLVDSDSFVEYGPLVVAAQRARRSPQELREKSPGDGLVGGLATVNAAQFGRAHSQCVVMSYDYTVFAGTQGQKNHRKKDRLFELADNWRLPVVLFGEGGGGRPGETERNSASGLNCLAFWYYARLKGRAPLVGIASGRSFAGNAVLLGCSDVIIATENANIGMGGPAMIEGGGLGVYRPEEVGPLRDQAANGVVDVAVKDEAEAVAAARQYLGYFQGCTRDWECADQASLRAAVPENRLRVYDVRKVIHTLADTGSVLELRESFAPGMITALTRVEGRPLGVIANHPGHLGGAIDSPGADKAARFAQLCNAFDIPLLFLCDTPGIMVGPDAEKTALVRHASRLFVAGAKLRVPFFTVVLRKAYGLGAQTMAGGSFNAPVFTVSWPTGEFGGMGLEGAVKLGYRRELEAIDDPRERETYFQKLLDKLYELGKATTVASYFDLDDVIDPKDTRHWIVRGLETCAAGRADSRPGADYVDTW